MYLRRRRVVLNRRVAATAAVALFHIADFAEFSRDAALLHLLWRQWPGNSIGRAVAVHVELATRDLSLSFHISCLTW